MVEDRVVILDDREGAGWRRAAAGERAGNRRARIKEARTAQTHLGTERSERKIARRTGDDFHDTAAGEKRIAREHHRGSPGNQRRGETGSARDNVIGILRNRQSVVARRDEEPGIR